MGLTMRKMFALALVVTALWTVDARAVEFKNVRATYGPFGAPRSSSAMLPGDTYMMFFDLTGLKIDAKGVAKYEIGLEVFDPKGKSVVKESTNKKAVIVALGGSSVPEFARVMLGVDQPPGDYKVVVTVTEDGAKTPSKLEQKVQLQPKGFGMIQVWAQPFGFVGQDYMLHYGVVEMARDANKMPKMTFTTRIIDEATGKATLAEPQVSKFPEDLSTEQRAEIAKQGFIPVDSPMFLNRAGKFRVEVDIRDELAKKSLKFSYSLTVLDSSTK
jgi:hypothetical protein